MTLIPTSVLTTLAVIGCCSLGVWGAQLIKWLQHKNDQPQIQESEEAIELRYLKNDFDRLQSAHEALKAKDEERQSALLKTIIKE